MRGNRCRRWYWRGAGRRLVAQQAHVVLLDRDLDKCRELAATLGEHSVGEVSALGCDIADPASVEQAAAQVQALHGRCDVLVNNASVLRPGALDVLSLEQWNQVLAVNLTGYLVCAQPSAVRCWPVAEAGWCTWPRSPRITRNPIAVPTVRPRPGSACCRARLPWNGGTRCAQQRSLPRLIRTPLSAAFYADPQIERQRSAMTANQRIGEPQDIADAVLFLASQRADYINGAELTVDGGLESMPMALIPRPGFEGVRA